MSGNEKISQYRAEVIEQAINIETIVNAIICQHYLKRVRIDFWLQVLYDEYFSFGLKRRILTKIVDEFDNKKIQDLNRLINIRNYFAHYNQEIIKGAQINDGTIPDPRNTMKSIDFEQLYEEFKVIATQIETWLSRIYQNKGGQLFKYQDGKFILANKVEET